MEDFADRYGRRLIKMVDIRASGKEFEFDQVLLMPTAAGYCALVEQARIEISPRIMKYLSLRWSEGSIENLSLFAVSADVYARSVSDPPVDTDVGRVLPRSVAFCNRRCANRKGAGAASSCRLAINRENHYLPKCIKIPGDIAAILVCLKRYIATGKAASCQDAMDLRLVMVVKVDPGLDYVPATSC